MNPSPLYINRDDYTKLRLLVSLAVKSHASDQLTNLLRELDRAIVVDASAIPAGVVTMGSHVEYQDLTSGDIESYTLVFPERADITAHRLSVLAPIGTALLGSRENENVSWNTPGGVRHLRIRRVEPAQPEPSVALPYHLLVGARS